MGCRAGTSKKSCTNSRLKGFREHNQPTAAPPSHHSGAGFRQSGLRSSCSCTGHWALGTRHSALGTDNAALLSLDPATGSPVRSQDRGGGNRTDDPGHGRLNLLGSPARQIGRHPVDRWSLTPGPAGRYRPQFARPGGHGHPLCRFRYDWSHTPPTRARRAVHGTSDARPR